MPPKVPPPPRPDPVTLEHIYVHLTQHDISYEAKAYHLVALNTVAFHPSVKLFLFEHTPVSGSNAAADEAAEAANRMRRESVLKCVAFFLAQRNNAVCLECRWETVSLLGELCRMESTHKNVPTTPRGQLESKINEYARCNLAYLAQLLWFVPALRAIIGAHDSADSKSSSTGASSTEAGAPTRENLKRRMEERRLSNEVGEVAREELDEDVVIAIEDILRALPTLQPVGDSPGAGKEPRWTAEQVEQAHDLMFLDASTSMLHLIPAVSRSSSACCAQCRAAYVTDSPAFLRCSSCKAVYYCSADCQKSHWATAHRAPCKAYKERCDTILEEYYRVNAGKKKDKKKGEVEILEVPLEPTLFFETRRYLYDHRDSSFDGVDFNDYFMKYTVHGT